MLRTRIVSAMCTPHHVDDYLELLDSAWSVRDVRAHVARVQPESGDATSLWLQPNENWRGFRAGQFVNMKVRIGGVRYMRCFSISSAPEDGSLLRITNPLIARWPGRTWAARAASRRDVVVLSQALGDFVLPNPVPAKLLFISGGSGITPIMSIVRHLLAKRYAGDLVWLHYARHESIFSAEVAELAQRHSQLQFVTVLTGNGSPATRPLRGHFCLEQLETVAPSWTECEAFVCGPAALSAAVSQLFHARGLAHRLHEERFVSAIPVPVAQLGIRRRITLARSGRTIDGKRFRLAARSNRGRRASPPHGCRIGICHSCKCKKLSGAVRNVLTGAVSHGDEEEIQLCVNTPHSDITLDL